MLVHAAPKHIRFTAIAGETMAIKDEQEGVIRRMAMALVLVLVVDK